MQLIKLTRINGEELYLNVNKIEAIYKESEVHSIYKKGFTKITTANDMFWVWEEVPEVLAKISLSRIDTEYIVLESKNNENNKRSSRRKRKSKYNGKSNRKEEDTSEETKTNFRADEGTI